MDCICTNATTSACLSWTCSSATISALPDTLYQSLFTFNVLVLLSLGLIIGIWSFR